MRDPHPAGPMHSDLVVALRVLDADGLPYAEMWRQLRPIAGRLGVRRPSYWRVRRFLIAERRRKRRREAQLERVLIDLGRGYPRRP